jgi:hypothetical protein
MGSIAGGGGSERAETPSGATEIEGEPPVYARDPSVSGGGTSEGVAKDPLLIDGSESDMKGEVITRQASSSTTQSA